MKYVVILGDGMADRPVPELSDKTPLEAAYKPCIDLLCALGENGMVKTVPDGMSPGSDTANLSVMGYDPKKYYTGRSPLEAVSMGIELKSTDMTYRCNLVTLSDAERYEDKVMVDYSSDEISTQEATILVEFLNEKLCGGELKLYPGISYRHCLVLDKGNEGLVATPPHDILEKRIGDYAFDGENSGRFWEMMKASYDLLKDHPVNLDRVKRGLRPANSMWLWGEGRKPMLDNFKLLYGLNGAVISAVDLIKGIGKCAGLKSIDVEGATGNIHTNFEGKAQACLDELKNGADYVYIHIEAPDECGHRYEIYNKVKSIEMIDEKVVKPIFEELTRRGEDFGIMVLPDHPTPLSIRTHSSDPVPYLMYYSNKRKTGAPSYTERYLEKSINFISEGHTILRRFIDGGRT